jgi:hypothetical protein
LLAAKESGVLHSVHGFTQIGESAYLAEPAPRVIDLRTVEGRPAAPIINEMTEMPFAVAKSAHEWRHTPSRPSFV